MTKNNHSFFKIIFSGFMLMLLNPLYALDDPKMGAIEAVHQGKKISFPLLESHYRVNIQGDLVTVKLEQLFSNPSAQPLNATYLFPLNQNAAVYGMQMAVGDEIVKAEIKRIETAKKIFNAAKKAGKAASMLEQKRPNMFVQNLANLMPNLPIKITLKYTQTVKRKDHLYELVLPLVVGPRYQSAKVIASKDKKISSETTFNQWELESTVATPPTFGVHLGKNQNPERVSIEIQLDAGLAIQYATSPSHQLNQKQLSETSWQLSLKKGKVIDNRDFILRYQLAAKTVQAGLLTHQDETGNYFSLLIEPPELSTPENTIAREMVFVLDTSGSMGGYPLKASKIFMQHAVKNLRANDYFRMIDFGDSPREFSKNPLLATPENIQRGMQHINRLSARGGTNINSAIKQAFITKPKDNHLRIVVFLTDGYIGSETTVLKTINRLRGEARIYSFGVGSSVNRYLLDEMAFAGHGFSRYIDPTQNVQDSAIKFANDLSTPVLSDIEIDWGTLKPRELTPKQWPDLFIGDSLRIMGKFEQAGEHIIKVKGKINGKKAILPLKITIQPSQNSQAIPLIWARSQIKDWMREFNLPARLQHQKDQTPELIKQNIIQLGLNHSLMTRWTSFVAVSEKIVNAERIAVERQVPIPMPAGVSKQAYNNFAGSSAPEPAVYQSLLMGFMIGLIFYFKRKKLKLRDT